MYVIITQWDVGEAKRKKSIIIWISFNLKHGWMLIIHIFPVAFIELFIPGTIQITFICIIISFCSSNNPITLNYYPLFLEVRQLGGENDWTYLRLDNRIHPQVLSFYILCFFHYAIHLFNSEDWLLEFWVKGSFLCVQLPSHGSCSLPWHMINSTNVPNPTE